MKVTDVRAVIAIGLRGQFGLRGRLRSSMTDNESLLPVPSSNGRGTRGPRQGPVKSAKLECE